MTAGDRTLVDTCVLLGATDERRPSASLCLDMLETCTGLVLASQVVREYLVVATRPLAVNGLGLSLPQTLENIDAFLGSLPLLPEDEPVLPTFFALLRGRAVAGKRIHDAHLAATAHVHRVPRIVTFNASDFSPFRDIVRVIEPATLLRG